MGQEATITKKVCHHCGDECIDDIHVNGDLDFCCNGCDIVYHLLQERGMGDYYKFEVRPGVSLKSINKNSYEYLDNEEIKQKLLSFHEGNISKITFTIPQIHCSSCLYLLENISSLDDGVIRSIVNFSVKKATITFDNSKISLRALVELLAKIGYGPTINYNLLDQKDIEPKFDNILIYKLGLAGFCFGNIMLLSFPEYLGFDRASYLFYIGYINILLSLPILFYSGADYIKSAIKGLRYNDYNIDLPIAIGMLALFSRSVFEILSHTGEGYLDSFSGFVFFLLIGRWFQSYTYKNLDFERNYKSYFPISANVKDGNQWKSISLNLIKPGDIVHIRNEEILPTDGILHNGVGKINYSFVTGESKYVSKSIGDELYAGGKQEGKSLEILVTKKVNHSYLTQLWNEDVFKKEGETQSSKMISVISKYFTFGVLTLAFTTMLYWSLVDAELAVNTFTAVLIVACPCALALAIPFTYGNILRLLTSEGVYFKNVETIERIQDVDYVIFDKTGTLTDSSKLEASYHGKSLNADQRSKVKSICTHSFHPLSMAITRKLATDELMDVSLFKSHVGHGVSGVCKGEKVRIGSSKYIFDSEEKVNSEGVFIEIAGEYLGCFKFRHEFRKGIDDVIKNIKVNYKISVLSGDSADQREWVQKVLGADVELHFNKSPKEKLEKIKQLQLNDHKVMMVGDGLNDAGALKQAHVGIVISDKVNNFSPACDGIIDSSHFWKLGKYLRFVRCAKYIILGAFVLAVLYNSIGLYFAMRGELNPIIAAILMPLSSITVIVYGVIASWLLFINYVSNKS